MPKMVTVELTDLQLFRAAELEQIILARIPKRANYTGITRIGRYRIGYLGEFALANWFEQAGAIFLHRIRPTGKREQPEFMVDLECRTQYAEVKCAGDERTMKFRHNARQPIDAYVEVGCKIIDTNHIGLMGWLYGKEVAALPVVEGPKGAAYTCQYQVMRPMQELAAMLYPVFHVKRDSLQLSCPF